MRINFSSWGRPVHGVLLRQPQETHTGGKDLEREVKIPVETEQLCPPPLHRPSVQVSEAGREVIKAKAQQGRCWSGKHCSLRDMPGQPWSSGPVPAPCVGPPCLREPKPGNAKLSSPAVPNVRTDSEHVRERTALTEERSALRSRVVLCFWAG